MNGKIGSPVVWAVAVAAVLLAALAVVALDRSDAPEPGTPEATVAALFSALLDGDDQAVEALLTPELASRCERPQLHDSGSVRVTLTDSEVREQRAEVTVTVAVASEGDPLGGSYSYDATFELVKVDDTWLVEELPWPVNCEVLR